jgi:hypothetical protein
MAVEWDLEGVKFGNCSCDYSCPCQFETLPTNGACRGIEVVRVDQGRFGALRLDGLKAALLYAWPGPIHEGNGSMQAIIDERAEPAQRKALSAILHGEETREAATHWWVFTAMSSEVHETLFKPIDFDIDVDARTARARIPGLLEAVGAPIRGQVSGNPHRIRIDLPDGIEFELAEIGSGSTEATAALALTLNDTYGQFNRFHLSGNGIVRRSSVDRRSRPQRG